MKDIKSIKIALGAIIAVFLTAISIPVAVATSWITVGDDGKGGNPVKEYYPQVDIREYKYKIEDNILYFKIVTEERISAPEYPVKKWYFNVALDTKEKGQEWQRDFKPDYQLLVWIDSSGKVDSALLYYENEKPQELGKLDYLEIAGNTIELGVRVDRIENIKFQKIAVEIAGAYETFQNTEWNHVDIIHKFFIDARELKAPQVKEREAKVAKKETSETKEKVEITEITGRMVYRSLDPLTSVIAVLIGLNLVLTVMLLKRIKEREAKEGVKETFSEA